jgi:Matrixin
LVIARRLLILALFAIMAVLSVAVLPASGSPKAGFDLPAQASEVAQGVFYLGSAVHDGVVVDGYAIAAGDPRERRANAKPPWAGGGGGGGGGGGDPVEDCYSFIANGAKWLNAEGYQVDAGELTVLDSVIDGAFDAWEDPFDEETEIVGNRQQPIGEFEADIDSPDGRNEVYAASMSDPEVLGYTIVWSTRKRGRNPGQIIEADMVIDSGRKWAIGADDPGAVSGAFDIRTVVTHEAGHWVGMGHAPTTTTCTDQLMYPSVSTNTAKGLGVGDEAGIKALY